MLSLDTCKVNRRHWTSSQSEEELVKYLSSKYQVPERDREREKRQGRENEARERGRAVHPLPPTQLSLGF